ncbi:MAG: TIGR02646 family protein [Planctomycetaceae bacterium]|jgi:uncharacterized protein (TIGR02646 family)|nr:TIGR02646 family protein [Planctomycetaceae bacterium]
MKFINKSEEPQKLRDYRQKHPNNQWEQFRNECQTGLDEVYKTLKRDQGGICAYCEIKIQETDRQVEHFHDKSDKSDPNNPMRWHLDWNNLLYCCKGGTQKNNSGNNFLAASNVDISCGEHKKFGEYQNILSPLEIPMFPRIFSYEISEGSIWIRVDEKLCLQAGIDKTRAEQTIKVLNLNCKRLREARYSVMKQINFSLWARQHTNPDTNQDQVKKLIIRLIGNKDSWGQFFTMIRHRFNDVVEKYLHEIQDEGNL